MTTTIYSPDPLEESSNESHPLGTSPLIAGSEAVLQSLLVDLRLAASWAHSFAEEERRHDPSVVFSERNRRSLKSSLATLNRLSTIFEASPSD